HQVRRGEHDVRVQGRSGRERQQHGQQGEDRDQPAVVGGRTRADVQQGVVHGGRGEHDRGGDQAVGGGRHLRRVDAGGDLHRHVHDVVGDDHADDAEQCGDDGGHGGPDPVAGLVDAGRGGGGRGGGRPLGGGGCGGHWTFLLDPASLPAEHSLG